MAVFANYGQGQYITYPSWSGSTTSATFTLHTAAGYVEDPKPPKPKPTQLDWLASEIDSVCALAR